MSDERSKVEAYGDIRVEISAMLGRASMSVEQFLKLGRGSIVELNQHKEDDIIIYVNEHPVARAEIRVIDDKVGFAVTDVISKNIL